jgi:HNH/ENDO VII superfamily nuclease with conserved GHE residues
MDHEWMSRWQKPEYEPPGFAEAYRYKGHDRFTIDADGETNYDQFQYNQDKVIAFNLFAGFENVYLGDSRQAPKIRNVRLLNPAVVEKAIEAATEATAITTRPTKFRTTVPSAVWSRAEIGANGGRLCSTCGKELFWQPGERRLGLWDVDHFPKWKLRNHSGMSRKEVLDDFNDLEQLRNRCIPCNRPDN